MRNRGGCWGLSCFFLYDVGGVAMSVSKLNAAGRIVRARLQLGDLISVRIESDQLWEGWCKELNATYAMAKSTKFSRRFGTPDNGKSRCVCYDDVMYINRIGINSLGVTLKELE
jgi:hypothetical protein